MGASFQTQSRPNSGKAFAFQQSHSRLLRLQGYEIASTIATVEATSNATVIARPIHAKSMKIPQACKLVSGTSLSNDPVSNMLPMHSMNKITDNVSSPIVILIIFNIFIRTFYFFQLLSPLPSRTSRKKSVKQSLESPFQRAWLTN